MKEKKLVFENKPEDIAEAFGLLCSYLELDKSKEEQACVKSRSKKVNHEVMINFAVRHKLTITLSPEEIVVVFRPKTLDISTRDEEVSKDEEVIEKDAQLFEENVIKLKEPDEDDWDEL